MFGHPVVERQEEEALALVHSGHVQNMDACSGAKLVKYRNYSAMGCTNTDLATDYIIYPL